MKKVLKGMILTLCTVFVLFSFSGCSLKGVFGSFEDYVALFDLLSGNAEPVLVTPAYEVRTVGDFVVRFYEDRCEIVGTSEQGNEKSCLIVPEQIEGVPVTSFGVRILLSNLNVAIKSDVLEKIYIEGVMEIGSVIGLPDDEKKVTLFVIQAQNFRDKARLHDNHLDFYMCIPREVQEEQTYGTAAKVSYYYNYENEKGKYYWIDDYDYGSKIKYAPPTPTREGYVFDGWYKESECINKWDFDEDTLPEEKTQTFTVTVYGTDENGEPFPIERERTETVFQETILYAKWIQE